MKDAHGLVVAGISAMLPAGAAGILSGRAVRRRARAFGSFRDKTVSGGQRIGGVSVCRPALKE